MANDELNFFEMIVTRTDDHEFVAVARHHVRGETTTTVDSGADLADVWRRLAPEPRGSSFKERLM